jgi:peptidoglycan/xylan/chitin deacetylase (PgdA/CDA1 family)
MHAPVSTLMYHDVVRGDFEASGFQGPGPAHYKLSIGAFLEHLDALREATGRAPASVAEVIRGDAPRGAWLLTFDDGGSSAVETAQALSERGWRGHFFVVTDRLGTPGFLDHEEVRVLAEMGHVVGTHSASHPRMSACSRTQLAEEWLRSIAVLSDLVGAPVTSGSVPGGHYSAAVGRAAAASGLSALFTSRPARRVGTVDGCLLLGRYAIRSQTPAAEAAQAARGAGGRWPRQRAAWSLRAVAKRAGGPAYERLRTRLLASGAGRRREP